MGIPAFYRWLVENHPRSVVEVVEDSPAVVNGVEIPVDTTAPNPNGAEFDNLYLDMNGIIHPCFHPENLPAPKSYDEVFTAVFKYIDRIFSLVRPRKLMYMAVDGVAPRAKMNQQRARRFKAAKEAADEASVLAKRVGYHAQKEGLSVSKGLDSNVITPGTGFMELLSSALQYYIHLRMNNDPGWKGVKVILSDASVPGEGEHKIMSYIRLQRNLPGFDPNTRHCLYGLDADLIMLALATHEIHFSVLREDVRREPSNGKGNLKYSEGPCRHLDDFISRQKFQFLNVWILRDYLAESLRIPDPLVKLDLERLIDDFVFMCLFVGNDFLPHVPSLEISEGAIDLLISVYKREFVRMGGYLTDSSEVNLKRVEHFVQTLGSHENAIFKKRRQGQMAWERHAERLAAKLNTGEQNRQMSDNHVNVKAGFVVDKVNLGEDGWKERYYTDKFEVQTDDDRETVRRHAVLKYVEGICWVMHYYYQGVCSWQWFYPYHYAPFASDFHGLDHLKFDFVLGKPFKPFNQLMGVLPAASAEALPLHYRNLMTDPSSPILDFYPTEFVLDLNGRKQAWKAVCRLPFIEEDRLLAEIAKVEHTLTDAERQRNTFGLDKLFVHVSHALAAKMFSFLERNQDNPKLHKAKVKRKISPKSSGGMNGYICFSDKPLCPAEIPSSLCDMKTIMNNKVVFVFYKCPKFHPHIPRPPEGVIMPQKSIRKRDLLPPPTLWHEKTAVGQSRFTRRPLPSKSIAGASLAKFAHQLIFATLSVSNIECQGKVGEGTHDALRHANNKSNSACLVSNSEDPVAVGKMTLDDLNGTTTMKLDSTCLVSNSEHQGDPRNTIHDALNSFLIDIHDALTDDNKKRKVSGICLSGNSEEQGEDVEMTHGAQNDNKKKRKKRNKKRKLNSACLVNSIEDQGGVGKMTDDTLNENTAVNLDSTCLLSKSEDQVEVAKMAHEAQIDNNTVKLDGVCLINHIEDQGDFGKMTHDALNDNTPSKLGSARLVNKSEDQVEVGKTACDVLNGTTTINLDSVCFVSNIEEQGDVGGTPHDAPNDSQKKRKKRNKKRKLESTCLVRKSEDQVEHGDMANDAQIVSNTTKLDGVCFVSNSEEQGDVGKTPQDAPNDSNKKKRKKRNKKRKLESTSRVSKSEDQVEHGEMAHYAQIVNNTVKLDGVCLIGNSEGQVEVEQMTNDALNGNTAMNLDSACLVRESNDQLEAGEMTHEAGVCLIRNSEDRGQVGNTTHDALNDNSTKMDSACLVSHSEDRVEVGTMAHDAPNDSTTMKLDGVCFVGKCKEQGVVGDTAHDAPNDSNKKKRKKRNKKRKLDSTCLASNIDDQREVGEGTDDALNESNKKKRKKRNKTRKSNNACLVRNHEDQEELGNVKHDDLNDNITKFDSTFLVSKIEDQVVGKMTDDSLNDKKTTKLDMAHYAQIVNNTIKLDGVCLIGNSEGQVEFEQMTNDALNGNTAMNLDSACLVRESNDQLEAGEMTHEAGVCLIRNSEDRGQVGNTTHDALNDNSTKMDSACLVSHSEDRVEVGTTAHDAPNDSTTMKLDGVCFVGKCKEQGVVGDMAHDAPNDSNKKKRKKRNKKRKLDSTCLASNIDDQREVGEETDDALNESNKKKRKKRNKTRKSNNACLVRNHEDQEELGNVKHDDPNDNITKFDSTFLVSKIEDQVVGKMTDDSLNDKKTTKLDSTCLVSKIEDQGEVMKMTHDPHNTTVKFDSSCLGTNSEDQGEVKK